MRRSPSIAVLLLAAAQMATLGARATELQSYEASYEIRLKHASEGEGPRAVVGVMDSSLQETCDGWATKKRTVVDLAFRDSSNFTNERFFESWESKVGGTYSFSVRTFKNGEAVEAFRGAAEFGRNKGKAVYEAIPEGNEPQGKPYIIELPEGTMLPVAHMSALLDHAESGQSIFRRVLLNGALSEGPRVHSVAIGKKELSGAKPDYPIESTASDIERLLSAPSWQVSAAQYSMLHEREVPNSELFFRLHRSGVTEYFEQTFEDFRISGRLTYLRRLDPPQCN